MAIIIAGLSHHTAPIEVRERVAVGQKEYSTRVIQLCQLPGVDEAVIVGTCNRLELYCSGPAPDVSDLLDWIHSINSLPANAYDGHFYVYHDEDAVRHLISVAGGLDSLVIGEPQILGQLKESWQMAKDAGTAKSVLDRLFQHAFGAAKRIRTNSEIGDHPVSVAYTTVVLARQIFDDLSQKTVVLVGAGDMIRLCARHLAPENDEEQASANLIIVNRDQGRARDLVNSIYGEDNSARVVAFDKLDAVLPLADILISSTSSPEVLIRASQVKKALRRRRRRPMFMVDIAVPRDIDPEVTKLDGVYLYTIDDLQQVVDENLNNRNNAALAEQPAVDNDARAFMRWLNGNRAAQTLENVRSSARDHGIELKDRALRQLRAGQDPETVLKQLVHTLANRILHLPSKQVREAAEARDYWILEAAERIFRDDRKEPGKAPETDEDDGASQ
jgi:glutamyl-tRNA reductase